MIQSFETEPNLVAENVYLAYFIQTCGLLPIWYHQLFRPLTVFSLFFSGLTVVSSAPSSVSPRAAHAGAGQQTRYYHQP